MDRYRPAPPGGALPNEASLIQKLLLPLAVLALAAPAPSPAAPAIPPAAVPAPSLLPAGIEARQASSVERALREADIVTAPADIPDEPKVAEEIDRESAELEEMRAAEEASHVQEDGSAVVPHEAGEGRIALLPEIDHDLAQLQAEYDIPIEVNEAVVRYVRFFQSPAARRHFVKWLGRSHRYEERYREILREEGLPEDTVYLAMIESGFGNFAYSRARASGPWQFIASTGKHFGLAQDFWVDERRDPEKSARAAARYLKELLGQTGDWRLAWAGYNAGAGRILRAKRNGYESFWEMAAVKGRRVLRAETKGYVPKLMAAAIVSKHREAFGFQEEEIERQAWTEYERVTIPSATLLSVIARAAGTSERELIDLNPELRRACTPPRPYEVKIPKDRMEEFARNWPSVQGKVRMTFAGHVVRRGDTLSAIAARHGVPVEGIMEMNGLRSPRGLRIGQELVIPRPVGGASVEASRPAPARAEATARVREARAAVTAPAASRSHTTLRVRRGDTLWSISRRHGVELDDLCRWNGIEDPRDHTLLVGTKLVILDERG